MKRPFLLTAVTALVVAAAASLASAAPEAYKLDPSHTQVGFNIRHFFSKVPGRFTDFSGTIMLDEKNLAASSVDVTIQATSINTAHEKRDNHLRSADFFAVDSFPTLTFKSTKVTPGQNGALKVAGDLTIRGVTKPVVLDGAFLGAGALESDGRSMGTRAGFEATTTINRKDYGILWNKVFDKGGAMLGDDVAIAIQVEAVKVEPAAGKADDAKGVSAKPEAAKPPPTAGKN